MSAREDIMNRIKSALRDAPETPVVPRKYRRSSTMTDAQRLEQLVDRLAGSRLGQLGQEAGGQPSWPNC